MTSNEKDIYRRSTPPDYDSDYDDEEQDRRSLRDEVQVKLLLRCIVLVLDLTCFDKIINNSLKAIR